MRVAIISDVHGNLPALEAVIKDIRARGADLIVNLGDCVTSPLWPRETFEKLLSLALPTVRGNHDRLLNEAPEAELSQSERYGTPLGAALRVLAQESRDQRMTAAEKKAAALPPTLTVPMILFFLPGLFAAILSPAAIQINHWS